MGTHRLRYALCSTLLLGTNILSLGSLTLLFSQNVSGLQIKTPAGEYKDIKPLDGSIVVNIADTLSFMTKGRISLPRLFYLLTCGTPGYLKSTIHRVHRPPPDQDHIE